MKVKRSSAILVMAAMAAAVIVAFALFVFNVFNFSNKASFKDVYPTLPMENDPQFAYNLVGYFSEWAQKQGAGKSKKDRPHVILISLDTLRADHLGSYGYGRNTSPYMDKLAEQGVRFSNVISQSPKTLPSHMTMFTGLYPSVHGVHLELKGDDSKIYLLNEEVGILPQWFKQAGYRTAAWTGGGQMAPEAGFGRGFDEFSDGSMRFLNREKLGQVSDWFEANAGEPCFMFIHTYQIHYPYVPPRQYVEFFDPDYDGWIISDWNELVKVMKEKNISLGEAFWGGTYGHEYFDEAIVKKEAFSKRDIEHLKALYDGDILFTDNLLTEFVNTLIAKGLMDNTILVITSDHGEEFMEHGDFLHRRLYRETVQVPLIIFYPRGLPAGTNVNSTARLIDLPATLLELAGIEKPEQIGGKSLLPLIDGEQSVVNAYSEEPWVLETYHRSLRFENYLFYDKGEKGIELYDLSTDRHELVNIAPSNPELVEKMKKRMGVLLNSEEFTKDYPSPAITPLMGERLKELRNLGYIE